MLCHISLRRSVPAFDGSGTAANAASVLSVDRDRPVGDGH
jgi:hypothetical protein